MGKVFDAIPENIIEWIRKQEVFWVATAPLAETGHVNVSPKGVRGTFVVEGPNHVWYEDLSGSGCETIAHIRENERITICFNAFTGGPQIVRLYGRGTVFELGSGGYNERLPANKRKLGSRAVIDVKVHRVSTSCGFGLPYYDFVGHRVTMLNWLNGMEKKDREFDDAQRPPQNSHQTEIDTETVEQSMCENGMRKWWAGWNMRSIDGLPALESAATQRIVPLGGKMPDPVEAGMRIRETRKSGSNDNQSKSKPEQIRPVDKLIFNRVSRDGNVKFAAGIVLGFFLSFFFREIVTFTEKAMLVHV